MQICLHFHLSGSEVMIFSWLSPSLSSSMRFLFLLAAQAVSVVSEMKHWVLEDTTEVDTKNDLPFCISVCLLSSQDNKPLLDLVF